MLNTEYWPSSFFLFLWTKMKLRSITLQKKKEANIQPFWGNNRVQRKSFLQLAIQASWSEHLLTQKSFQLAPKTFWLAELISQFFCYSNSSKNITCPSGKLKTEFTSPIAKSTSPGLSTLLSLYAETSLVNTGFIIWLQKRTVPYRTDVGNPERARWAHLARLRSQSELRIHFILPTWEFSHYDNLWHWPLSLFFQDR